MSRPAFSPKAMASARPCTSAGDAGLVDHLRQLAGTRSADAGDGACIGQGHRPGHRVEGGRLAAAHDGQRTVLRAGLAAGHRRVDEMQAMLAGIGVQLARHRGRSRGVVHQHRTRRHAGAGAVTPQHHAAQVVIVADAGEHDLAHRLQQPPAWRPPHAAVLRQPGLGLGGAAVVDGDACPARARCPAIGSPITPRPRKATLREGTGS